MVLKVTGLKKEYIQGDKTPLPVLKGVNLELKAGTHIALMGESGSGKSTLLHCMTGLDTYNAGAVEICGRNLSLLKEKRLSELRNKSLGFVFQFHYLLKDFTVKQNIMIPCLISGISPKDAEYRAVELLSRVKLLNRMEFYPTQLSGGEQQRVAIARALIMEPQMLVMDEPTGNLDENLADDIMYYVMDICNERQTSIVMATHNKRLAGKMDKIYTLHDGLLSS